LDAGYSVSTLCDEVTGACEGDCRSAFVGREAHAELTANFVEYLHRDQRVSVRIAGRFPGFSEKAVWGLVYSGAGIFDAPGRAGLWV